MNKLELIEKFRQLADSLISGLGDEEVGHKEADNLLLEYINDHDITEAFNRIPKWYS